MNAEKLVDREKLEKELKPYYGHGRQISISVVEMKGLLKDCPFSPAKLAEIMGGAMWVVEKTKRYIQENLKEWKFLEGDGATDSEIIATARRRMCQDIFEELQCRESQAPASEIEKEIRDNRRKAQAWDKLQEDIKTWGAMPTINKWELERKMDKLLAQEEKS